jgi:hypothetical protein
MTGSPRIVVVGEPAEAGLRSSLIRGFRANGCSVNALDWGPWSPVWLASAAFRRPIFAMGFRRELRRRIDVLAESGRPDLVLVVKGALLDRTSIEYLRSRLESPVVCWNPDSPFDDAISNSGAGIPRTISSYDAYVTWADDVAERLSAIAARVLVIPFAWDPDIMCPAAGSGVAAGRIVFVGTGSRERAASLASLAQFRPLVFGAGWPKIEGVDVRPPVRGAEFCAIAGEARWNLNLLRQQNARSHNMRTFELPGSGGNQAAPDTADHREFLGNDARTVLFQSRAELESILGSDPDDLPPRSPTLLEGHTYRDRVVQLLGELGIC